jgi:hypothetical protein
LSGAKLISGRCSRLGVLGGFFFVADALLEATHGSAEIRADVLEFAGAENE